MNHSEVISERPSDALFVFDTQGDADILKHRPKKHKERKPLTADLIINARSAIPAVPQHKRPAAGTTDGILPPKRQRTGYVTHKELARLRRIADGHHESTVSVLVPAEYDIWDAPPLLEQNEPVLRNDKSPVVAAPGKRVIRSLRQPPVSLSANGRPVPAVPAPEGGYSYNPSFTAYEARLDAEGAKAVSAERKRLEEERAAAARAEAVARSAAEADAAEQRANLSEWDEESEWEGFVSGAEGEGGAAAAAAKAAAMPKRKTKAQRNRINRRKAEESRLKHEAAMRRRDEQARRILEIARDVNASEQERQLTAQQLERMREEEEAEGDDNILRRKQLGRDRIPEKDLELVLPDELEDSLRLLKPEGNLLKERYRSFLVRGKMESRRKIPFRKQAKGKLTEKWSHKDFTI